QRAGSARCDRAPRLPRPDGDPHPPALLHLPLRRDGTPSGDRPGQRALGLRGHRGDQRALHPLPGAARGQGRPGRGHARQGMTMGIYLKVAFRNLLQARRRSLLLGLALGAVSMLLVFLLAISQGMTNSLLETTTTLASGHVNVHGFFKPSMNSGAWPIIEDAEKLRPIVEESLPDIETVVSRGHGWGKIVSDTGTIVTSVTGIVPEEEGRLRSRLSLAPRSAYVDGGGDEIVGDLSRVGERGTIYLFASQARRLKVDVGDTVILSAETSGG